MAFRCAEIEPEVVEPSCTASTGPATPSRLTTATGLVEGSQPEWLRRVHAIVPVGDEGRLAVGTHGTFFDEGVWWIGFDADGQPTFRDGTRYNADRAVDVALAGTFVWVMMSGYDDTRLVRIDAAGNAEFVDLTGIVGRRLVGLGSGELTLFDFGGETIYGLDADGAIVWSSTDDRTPGGHVDVSQGVVRLVDETQTTLWSYDPRPSPAPLGFGGYGGVHAALLHEQGETAVLFTRLGPDGDESWVSRLDPEGEELWRTRLPRGPTTHVQVGGAYTLVIGHAQECDESPAYRLLDGDGAIQHQGTTEDDWAAWWLDADGTVWSSRVDPNEVELREYGGPS